MSPHDTEVQLRDIAVLFRSMDSVLLLESVKRGSGFFSNVSVNTSPAKLLVEAPLLISEEPRLQGVKGTYSRPLSIPDAA